MLRAPTGLACIATLAEQVEAGFSPCRSGPEASSCTSRATERGRGRSFRYDKSALICRSEETEDKNAAARDQAPNT
jgi:hypothetical protein